MRLPWVHKQIAEKLGFAPYQGTLNVRVGNEDGAMLARAMKKARAVEISSVDGFHRGKCFKAHLRGNAKCAVIVPEVTDYPENVLELIASASLRESLCLKDGDIVDVTIAV